MYPTIFKFIHMYGLCIAIGLVFCFIVLRFCSQRMHIDEKFAEFVEMDGYISILAGFGSAMLFQSFYDFIENPKNGFHFTTSITFIGGLLGGTIVFFLIYFLYGRKKYGAKFIEIQSILPCCILIAHCFGRIGCFFAGCCYGKETDSFIGVKFPDLIHKVYPTQLFEATFLFLLFILCLYLVVKKNFKYTFSIYLSCYGIFRFLIEFIRGDHRGKFIGSISPSQFWAILMIVLAIVVFFLVWKFDKLHKQVKEEDSNDDSLPSLDA